MLLKGKIETLPISRGDVSLPYYSLPGAVCAIVPIFLDRLSFGNAAGLDPVTIDKVAEWKQKFPADSARKLTLQIHDPRKLSINRVFPTYAATAISAPGSADGTGSNVFASTMAR
jgi:hypothetical protein